MAGEKEGRAVHTAPWERRWSDQKFLPGPVVVDEGSY
jgi:hypothetical protein